MLRTYGLEGLRAHIRDGVELAAHVEELVADDERLRARDGPRRLSLVVFRHVGGDERDAVGHAPAQRQRRRLPEPHPVVEGRAAIRLAVGSWRTTRADIDRTWTALTEVAAPHE